MSPFLQTRNVVRAVLVALTLGAIPVAAQEAAHTPFPESDDARALFDAISTEINESVVGNVALVLIFDGQIVGEHFASKGRLVGPNSLFQVASVSKWITAWGVMALVEEGRIDLDVPVSTYLTRWTLPESEFDNSGVTVRRLLSHSAGLTDGYGYGGFENAGDVQTLEESLTFAADANRSSDRGRTPPRLQVGLEPGVEHRYSGGGYTILQLVIEEITGKTFNDFMRDRVLEPLGMTASTFVLDAESEERLADSYEEDGSIAPNYTYTALAAASLYTSTNDLTRFLFAHLPGEDGAPPGRGVLRPETVAEMQEPQIVLSDRLAWGLGGMLMTDDGSYWVVGHTGSNRPAISTMAEIDPAEGRGIIVLSSGQPELTNRIYLEWVTWLDQSTD